MRPAVLLLLLAALLAAGAALALDDYDLSWWTVDGGGTTSSGGSYRLGGTIGQPDAGLLSGRPYTLRGGFWRGGAFVPIEYDYDTYLPLVLR
jgi:hypothetical protein